MIVKNEAHVIARCIESARPHIDSWIIVDTGSTDGTQELIKELLKDIPGELHERLWVDFATNRNEAIQLAKGTADYLLVVDADDVVIGGLPNNLQHDCYSLTVEFGPITFQRPHIFRSDMPFRYVGVIHEYLECGNAQICHISSLRYQCSLEGARRIDKTTYLKDVAILQQAVETETDEKLKSRYAFYLGCSYKDAGEKEKAIAAFEARIQMVAGFDEEVFVSMWCAAEMKADLEYPEEEVEKAYLRAYECRPSRIEPIHDLCVYLRLKEKYVKAYAYAKLIAGVTNTTDSLFVVNSIYIWQARDELASAAFYCGDKEAAVKVYEELLRDRRLPRDQGSRIVRNVKLMTT
jgi:glycosyltransferase involved in cell wall biosynthesis